MADVLVPGSKSITNRALFLAAAAEGRTVLHRPLVADDTQAAAQALAVLGYEITTTDPARWEVVGARPGPPPPTPRCTPVTARPARGSCPPWPPQPLAVPTGSTPRSRCVPAP